MTTDEDTTYTFAARDFRFSDTDLGDALSSVTIGALPAQGSLTLNARAVSQDEEVSRADLDAGHLVFTPAANANGSRYATFTFTVSDGAQASAATYTMTIDVRAVNDAPETANNKVTATQATGYAFAASDFEFTDIDGNALESVVVTSLPASGTGELEFDGTALSMTDLPKTVTATELDERKLVYDPPTSGSGADFASFQFKVHDGLAQSAAAATMSIDVEADTTACPAPNLTGRRQIWTAEMTVGALLRGGTPRAHGADPALSIGMLSDTTFDLGLNNYTIVNVFVLARDFIGIPSGALYFTLNSSLTTTELASLTLHVCQDAFGFASAEHIANRHDYSTHGTAPASTGRRSRAERST